MVLLLVLALFPQALKEEGIAITADLKWWCERVENMCICVGPDSWHRAPKTLL